MGNMAQMAPFGTLAFCFLLQILGPPLVPRAQSGPLPTTSQSQPTPIRQVSVTCQPPSIGSLEITRTACGSSFAYFLFGCSEGPPAARLRDHCNGPQQPPEDLLQDPCEGPS
uniref:Uncharacterized protein n=1 Tax=Eutreptiella gymnastica TaxID=73025 RepID=A0A7S4GHJ6_9EUGL|mmetsp:Transcript_4007/g.7480  ORF Transcript_4007/g.7480 Transcript_4007/m.7480 type:complete len:112 (-) Transcript_4007:63-398(-)